MTTIPMLQKELEQAYKDIKYYKNRIERLNNQLQQKEGIIKEAREYVYKMINIEPANSREYDYHCEKLAEILDKEVN